MDGLRMGYRCRMRRFDRLLRWRGFRSARHILWNAVVIAALFTFFVITVLVVSAVTVRIGTLTTIATVSLAALASLAVDHRR